MEATGGILPSTLGDSALNPSAMSSMRHSCLYCLFQRQAGNLALLSMVAQHQHLIICVWRHACALLKSCTNAQKHTEPQILNPVLPYAAGRQPGQSPLVPVQDGIEGSQIPRWW